MESSNQPIPYAARCERLPPSGTTALVWPFVNVAKGEGPYELFLDTNALARTEWAEQLPAAERVRYTLNPWPALMEQWMSNQKLRESPDPAAWVNDRLAPLASRASCSAKGSRSSRSRCCERTNQRCVPSSA